MESILSVLIGVILLVGAIVLIYNFVVMCQSIKRIADKIAPHSAETMVGDNNLKGAVVIAALLLLICLVLAAI